MRSEQLATLQARAYQDMAPWSARDFDDLLTQPTALLVSRPHAFCLGRVIIDEAEILALATDPDHQRRGLGTDILTRFESQAKVRGAVRIFLETAATNSRARAFYANFGYVNTGLRKGYYAQPDGSRIDAVLMMRNLSLLTAPRSDQLQI
ncbi:GNAT family N-acetyltransferase [Puniceibacterium sp. IMCC21224]|uniref:GNAT family N-acetyltransferase n=1 Tax=Puniceibacterium sp. IMCC21224 TaxID=1618204 RepID=UPI00065D2EC5|nr:GNAT family N-acetyltransferase [Puniceibacterium sp. IMCC21224]KMK66268.1 acetyltransferase [Puniceibacterium sp. IMCC21224]